MPFSPQPETSRIAAGANEGRAVSLDGHRIIGVIVPDLDTASAVRLQVSGDGNDFFDLKDTTGATLEFASGDGGFAMDADYLARCTGYPYVRPFRTTTDASNPADFSFILSQG